MVSGINKLTLIVLLVLLIPVVTSLPPQVSENVDGFEIAYPKYEYARLNSNFTLHTHVFNISSGKIIDNTAASCILHLYYPDGRDIFEGPLNQDANGIEFSLYISEGNFSELGEHAYIIQCNNSELGGFVSGEFIVTTTGTSPDTSQALMYMIIFFVSAVLLIASLYGTVRLPWKNGRDDRGYVINVNDLKYLKLFLAFMSYLLLIWISYLAWNISLGFLAIGIATTFFEYTTIFLTVFFLPALIITFVIGLINALEDKKLKKMISMGGNGYR